MTIYPSNLPQKLDFFYLLERLKSFCHSNRAKEWATQLSPISNFTLLKRLLEETNELLLSLHKGEALQIQGFPELDKELHLLSIADAALQARQILHLRKLVVMTNELIRFFVDKELVYPNIYKKVVSLTPDEFIVQNIDQIIHHDGIVKEDASDKLYTLRKELSANRITTDRLYRSHLQRLRKLGQLADIEENFVNGRRVIGVLAEYKREVKGIILGHSASGKIAYIEPQNLIPLNNQRLEMEEEEKKEIYAILKALTAFLYPFHSQLTLYYEMFIQFDFILAKAMLAKELHATLPILVSDESSIQLYNAYHPVLYLENKEKNSPTIPINCQLSNEDRIMVISGPNAGGKSITLKTIGLLQIMLQCGLLIPASAKSQMSIKQHLMGDIGDNQSIEDGLSTYSSRLQKMKYFLDKANENTLFLIDEFGTGSDPDMGGALAEVILDKLNNVKSQGVVTTHFTNLKILATNQSGIFNASMLFNSKTLKPLYQLQIGEPGSSFTFEVAEKIGLPQSLLQEAKDKLSNEKVSVDRLLNKLHTEKSVIAKIRKDLEKQMRKTTAEKREFQELASKLEDTLLRDLRNYEERKKYVELGKKLESLTHDWQQTKNKKEVIDKFVKLAGYEQFKKKEQEDYEKTEKFKASRVAKIKLKIELGSKVRMMNSKELGIIQEINENRAKVLFGRVLINVGLEKLEMVS